jgi:acyl dehydratase
MLMEPHHRTFDWRAQQCSAHISCDQNPIHVDAIAARRTHVGAPIVHGIHSLIWVLDEFARCEPAASAAKSLKAQFLQPIYVGDTVRMEWSRPTAKTIRARAMVGSEEVLIVSLGLDESPHRFAQVPGNSRAISPPAVPQEPRLDEMAALAGSLRVGPSIGEIAGMFPAAVRLLGLHRTAALVCSSCLVGMIGPACTQSFPDSTLHSAMTMRNRTGSNSR